MTVVVPGDYEEARLATHAAAAFRGPVYLRFGRDSYPVVPELHGGFEIGKAKVLSRGTACTIVSTGILTGEAIEAAQALNARGVSTGVIHMPTVKPLDERALVEAASATRCFVTAEEHSVIGGLGEAVCSALARHAPRPVRRIGMQDVFGESGLGPELLDRFGLRASNIVKEVVEICAR
jgi:transketolase